MNYNTIENLDVKKQLELVLGCFSEAKLNERSTIQNLPLRDLLVAAIEEASQAKACSRLGVESSHSILSRTLTEMTGWMLMQCGSNINHKGRVQLGKLLVQRAREHMKSLASAEAEVKQEQKVPTVVHKRPILSMPDKQQPNPIEQIAKWAKDPDLKAAMRAAVSY